VLIVEDGDDIVIGGVGADLVNYVPVNAVASDPAIDTGDDIVLGDDGEISFDTTIGSPLLTEVRTLNPTLGDDDFIYTGEAGDDTVLAGAGDDLALAMTGLTLALSATTSSLVITARQRSTSKTLTLRRWKTARSVLLAT